MLARASGRGDREPVPTCASADLLNGGRPIDLSQECVERVLTCNQVTLRAEELQPLSVVDFGFPAALASEYCNRDILRAPAPESNISVVEAKLRRASQ